MQKNFPAHNNIIALQQGESQLSNAPLIEFDNGHSCIPQQYLTFSHTRESVESIVLDIQYSDNYPIFVCADHRQFYIQIGIIGQDNYPYPNASAQAKIVYGRKWRVEPMLPTSEIIQTVYLAIVVAREHEIRELFRIQYKGAITTPFNNHQDLPALAHIQAEFQNNPFQPASKTQLKQLLLTISYDGATFDLRRLEQLDNRYWLFEIQLDVPAQSSLQHRYGDSDMILTFLLKECSINALLHELMAQLLRESRHQVAENFRYQGFRRFSRKNAALTFSKLSTQMRKKTIKHSLESFNQEVEFSNDSIDQTRIPQVHNGPLAEKIAKCLAAHPNIKGFLPNFTKA